MCVVCKQMQNKHTLDWEIISVQYGLEFGIWILSLCDNGKNPGQVMHYIILSFNLGVNIS